jgi:hypothetical protein
VVRTSIERPVRYADRIGADRLMSEINSMARKVEKGEQVDHDEVARVVRKYLR